MSDKLEIIIQSTYNLHKEAEEHMSRSRGIELLYGTQWDDPYCIR